MTDQERKEFARYLRNCTDQQVVGVWEKERAAGRDDYAALAVAEAGRRDIPWTICRVMFL